jgi:hypothetical protein
MKGCFVCDHFVIVCNVLANNSRLAVCCTFVFSAAFAFSSKQLGVTWVVGVITNFRYSVVVLRACVVNDGYDDDYWLRVHGMSPGRALVADE